jgi:CBS domain-containing protein
MKIRELMTAEPITIAPEDSIAGAAAKMRAQNIGMLPVCEGETLTGVITDRDIVVECVASDSNPAECRVRDHMTANPISIRPDAEVEEALHLMAQEQVRRLCVTDNQKLVGVVALADIAVQPLDRNALAEALGHISRRTWHLGSQRVHI